jgi:CBS domain-containing protein
VYEFLEYRVCDAMTVEPICVGPQTRLGEAAKIFDEHQFNGLPVLAQDGALLGVVTKLDLLAAFRAKDGQMFPPYDEIMARSVSELMTREPRAVTPRALLTDVLEKLITSRFKSLPVLDDGRLIGIISREDVLHALRSAAAGEVATGPI